MDDLSRLMNRWPVDRASFGLTTAEKTVAVGGDTTWRTRIASVSKLIVGLAAMVAVEEGSTALGEDAGPPGSTVEHLLSHASGLAFDSENVLAAPGRRRIYSNTGIEAFARHLEQRTSMPTEEYLGLGVLQPLGMAATRLVGSPAHGIESTVEDLLRFARELLQPTLVSAETLDDATRPHFPQLPGVLPGIGSFDPNPWGLTFEIAGDKQPHWTADANSPLTFGHFGGSGSFLWVDPEVGLAAVSLASRDFGPWALQAWPRLSQELLSI